MKTNLSSFFICFVFCIVSCSENTTDPEPITAADLVEQIESPGGTASHCVHCPSGCDAYPSMTISGASVAENDGSTTLIYTASGTAPSSAVTWEVGTFDSGGNFNLSSDASPNNGSGKTASFTIPDADFEEDLVVRFRSTKNCPGGCLAQRWDYKTFNVQPIPQLPPILAVWTWGPQDCFNQGDFIDFQDDMGPSTIFTADRLVWSSSPTLPGFDVNQTNNRIIRTFQVPNNFAPGCYTVSLTAYNDYPGGSVASNTVSVTFRINASGAIGCESCETGPGGPGDPF